MSHETRIANLLEPLGVGGFRVERDTQPPTVVWWRADGTSDDPTGEIAKALSGYDWASLETLDRRAAAVAEIKSRCQQDIYDRYALWRQINALAESVQAIAQVLDLLARLESLNLPAETKSAIESGLEMKAWIAERRAQSNAEEAALNG